MANIIPKLNLNKTPNLVDNNSLIFAKNARLDTTGMLSKDYSFKNISDLTLNSVDKLKFTHNNIFDRIITDLITQKEKLQYNDSFVNFLDDAITNIYETSNKNITTVAHGCSIVGEIAETENIYFFIATFITQNVDGLYNYKQNDYIIKYEATNNIFTLCNCNWIYSGGTIQGHCIKNLRNEDILCINEYSDENKNIPIKFINLNYSNYLDDESIYTLTPNIPIINLNVIDYFYNSIPNGVYQFFIRFKIREDYYTNWLLCSKEIYIGNQFIEDTTFGTLKYLNTHINSDRSIIFNVECVLPEYKKLYSEFQIGFILSSDDAIYAKTWKHFDINTDKIYFTYTEEEGTDIDIQDLTSTIYNLYNVKNSTFFKNKLYISNYLETDYDKSELDKYAKSIKVHPTIYNYSTTDLFIPLNNNNDNLFIGFNSPFVIDEHTKIYFGNHIINGITTKGVIENILSKNTQIDVEQSLRVFFSKFGFTTKDTHKHNVNDIIIINQDSVNFLYEQNNVYAKYSAACYNKNGKPKDNVTLTLKKAELIYNLDNKVETYQLDITSDSGTLTKEIINKIIDLNYCLNKNYNFTDINGKESNNIKLVLEILGPIDYTTTIPNKPGLEGSVDKIDWETNFGSLLVGNVPKSINKANNDQSVLFNIDINFTFNFDESLLNKSIDSILDNSTLLPLQTYKFFVHYGKSSGEITNGYECGEITFPYQQKCNKILYPRFENIVIPNGYDFCFFSILHVDTIVSTIFNIESIDYKLLEGNTNKAKISTEGIDLDINMGNVRVGNSFICQTTPNTTYEAVYHDSASSINLRYFGNLGITEIKRDTKWPENNDDVLYGIHKYHKNVNKDVVLTKCTPYLTKHNLKQNIKYEDEEIKNINYYYKNYSNLNLLGFICKVYIYNKTQVTNYYTDGQSIYKKQFNDSEGFDRDFSVRELIIKPKEGGFAQQPFLSNLNITKTEPYYIYSNFNLNYVSLRENIITTIKAAEQRVITDSINDSQNDSQMFIDSKIFKLTPSINNSAIYELPSMYKNTGRKNYFIIDETSKNIYNNTIRNSNLIGDEEIINVLKFNSNDYYNIPTNKGIITNLITLGDNILVHTFNTMYIFSGNNNLISETSEISIKEQEPFDNGLKEIFNSEFGYAGLQSKTNQILTDAGYIFFENLTKTIYLFNGQTPIKISDDISLLLKYKNIVDVKFANDYYNDRIFIYICFEDDDFVTLSYSILQNNLFFISTHDFKYSKSFSTKINCYFYNEDKTNIYTIDKNNFGNYEELFSVNNIYPNKYIETTKNVLLNTIDRINENDIIYHHLNDRNIVTKHNYITYTILDIINNDNYETIKTLNSIKWSGGFIKALFNNITIDNESNLADVYLYNLPCTGLLIYSDTCSTNLIDFNSIIANDKQISDSNSYKYPRFNQGIWDFNYFRDTKNTKNIFNYLPNNIINQNNYISDNNSLIEGKYFVIRFYFDKSFKLETLQLNTTSKI